ncbi:MAG: hypothetical protein GY944_30745 [bacterium]|nr:hypothetical protein [bacterium]
MTRVLIASAAYGGENVGDDAILAAIVEQLRAVEPTVQITAVARRPEMMAQWLAIDAIEIMGLRNRVRNYLAIASNDVLIVGGGALIAQYTHGLKGLVTGHPGYPMTMLVAAKLLGKSTMVYGAGVEDVTYAPARFCIRHVYNRADVITVRDEDSRNRLVNDLGVTKPPVITTADPVLSMSVPAGSEVRSILQRIGSSDSDAPLCIINFAYGQDRREELVDFIARTADHVISRFGARVLFIAMNVQQGQDRLGMEQVLERMSRRDRARILDLPYTHREVIAIASQAELVISSRMHLLIFAALSGTPIVGISRVPKIDAFLARFGLSAGADSNHLDFDRFAEVLNSTWEHRRDLRAKLDEQRESLKRAAMSNAEAFRNLLDRRS